MSVINHSLSLRILLAVDDSVYSTAAVKLLARIAWPAGTVVHVLALVSERLPLLERGSEAQSELDEAVEIRRWRDWAAAKVVINEAAAQLRAHNLIVKTDIGEGPPIAALSKRAGEVAADLIVIGAKGFNPAGGGWLSPTAHKLAHYAGHSVLVARPSRQVRPLNTLVAVDGTAKAWRAVEFLCSLSLFEWARVSVVNIQKNEPGSQIERLAAGNQGATMLPLPRSEAGTAYTVRIVDQLHRCGVQAWPLNRKGDPAEEILAIAQEQQADLIVIGVHTQPNIHWQGVAQKVVKYAPCSVLAVRREREEIEASSQDLGKETTGQVLDWRCRT